MGGNQVYNPALPNMPADMSSARNYAWNAIQDATSNPATAPFSFAYNADPLQRQSSGWMSYLMGGPTPNKMTPGGPQVTAGGGAPGTGLNLEDMIPMASGYKRAGDFYADVMKTGLLGDTSQLWGAKKALYGQNLSDSMKQAWQDNFLSGGRIGTGVANVLGDLTGKANIGLASEMAPYDFQNINEAANRRMGAAAGSAGLARDIENLIMGRVTGGYGMGKENWAGAQTMQDKAYQEWLRTQPGYGPMWQNMMAYATSYPFSAQAPTVATPWWQDILKGIIGAGGSAAGGYLSNPMLMAA